MKLIQTEKYLLLIDEEAEIKKGDWIFLPLLKQAVLKSVFDNPNSTAVKIIAYYPLTKEAKELDLPLLPNPFEKEVDVEKLAQEVYREYPTNPKDKPDWTYNRDIHVHKKRKAFIKGYKAAQSKQFSLEDMRKAIEMARNISDGKDTFTGEDISGLTEVCTYDWVQTYSDEEIIQSLSTQQLPKEFVPEYNIVHTDHAPNGFEKLLKFKTNSEDREEIVGTYKY